MRKLLLTTAFVLPITMGPALAQDADAPAEDMTAEQPMDGEEAMAETDAGMAEGEADMAEGEAEMADDEAAEAAMEAEVAASGKVAQQQAANELRLDWITDAEVVSPDGSTIGEINDLILDGETGQMIAAVIGVGGFLGIGEKQIAVPWDQLTVNYDAQEITSPLTEEEANAAPEYVFRDREAAPAPEPAAEPAADDAAEEAATDMPAEDTMAEPAAEGEMAPADDAVDGEADATMDAEPMDGEAEADATMEAEPMDGEAGADAAMEGESMDGEAETEEPAGN